MRIAVVAMGNLLRQDDGVGIHLLHLLRGRPLPPGVKLVEAGASALDVALCLTQMDRVLILDAANFGGQPGEMRLIDPVTLRGEASAVLSSHQTSVLAGWELACAVGQAAAALILAIQPSDTGYGTELTGPVASRLEEAANLAAAKLTEWSVS